MRLQPHINYFPRISLDFKLDGFISIFWNYIYIQAFEMISQKSSIILKLNSPSILLLLFPFPRSRLVLGLTNNLFGQGFLTPYYVFIYLKNFLFILIKANDQAMIFLMSQRCCKDLHRDQVQLP